MPEHVYYRKTVEAITKYRMGVVQKLDSVRRRRRGRASHGNARRAARRTDRGD